MHQQVKSLRGMSRTRSKGPNGKNGTSQSDTTESDDKVHRLIHLKVYETPGDDYFQHLLDRIHEKNVVPQDSSAA